MGYPGAGSGVAMLLMFGAMGLVMYFLIWRPEQKKHRRQQDLITALKKGDEVILSSGVFGKIAAVEATSISLEVADKVRIKVLKSSVHALAGALVGATSPAQPAPQEKKSTT